MEIDAGGCLVDRSLDDVSSMITHAKLLESDLLPLSQIIRYHKIIIDNCNSSLN